MERRRDDLGTRDLSQVSDEELTHDEQQELNRRLLDFIGRLRGNNAGERGPAAKAKRVGKWDPTARDHKNQAEET